MKDLLDLAQWRRAVADIYTDVRRTPAAGREAAWLNWRATRNDLFKYSPQSPLDENQKVNFRGLPYFPHNPEWRTTGEIAHDGETKSITADLGPEGQLLLVSVGTVHFKLAGYQSQLELYWISGYGGGLFLPFGDKTNGDSTYSGGRYLFDAIKGADLGSSGPTLNLDFNYSYNPSCAYHPRWVCPLAPRDNTLTFPVTAGEKYP